MYFPRTSRAPTPPALGLVARRFACLLLGGLAALACAGSGPSNLFGGGADGGADGASRGSSRDTSRGGQIACPGAACSVGAEVCCRSGEGGDATYTCAAASNGCDARGSDELSLALPCDDAADCAALGAGGLCCGTYIVDSESHPHVEQVACVRREECQQSRRRVILCGDGDASVCPAGSRCDVSQTALPGFRICVSD